MQIVVPSNDAFTKFDGWDSNNKTLVTNILEYHILQGTVATNAVVEGIPEFAATILKDPAYTNVTGGARVIINKQSGDLIIFTSGDGSRSTQLEQDILFSGGLLQMVDTVLVPPKRLEHVARDIYPNLRSFLGALYETDLAETFAEHQNVTIFAPWDTAFQLLAGTLGGMPKDELKNVMSYHVIPNQVLMSTDLVNATNWTTLATDSSGSPAKLTITAAGNNRYVDSAQLEQPDILLANGVLHMIGGVLNPTAVDTKLDPALATQAPAFPVSGDSSTGTRVTAPFTTALPCTTNCPVPTTSTAGATSTATNGAAQSTSTHQSSSSEGVGAALLPRCTGLSGAMAVGAGLLGVAAVM